MINFVNVKDQDLYSRKLSTAAAEQGMWGSELSIDSDGETVVTAVSTAGECAYNSDRLGIIMNYPIDKAGDEADHYNIAVGDRIIFMKAAGAEVEDDMLASKSTTTTWTGLTFGDALCVNTSGYLTSVAAADAPSGAITVAEFLKIENGIVFYRTVDSTDAVA